MAISMKLKVKPEALLYLIFMLVVVKAEQKELVGDIFQESSRSLFLPPQDDHKCWQEVPVVFFQTLKNESIRGNGSTPQFHSLEVCCEGYIRSPYAWRQCVPDCSGVSQDNCRNGFCRAPDRCECFDEFVRNERGACVLTCPVGCQYGRCYLNGTCACHPGYTLDPLTGKFCRPWCQQGCGNNQECVAPGKCDCMKGYTMTAKLGCQPVCSPGCGHGSCVGPNKCECFVGYSKRRGRNYCEADCHVGCNNGFCETLYKCRCWDGYAFDANSTNCLPSCGEDCQNGVCIAPGQCRCFQGYVLNEGKCEPACEKGCGRYGKCIEPNICGCGMDQQHCSNGSCGSNGNCICTYGLTRFVDKCIRPAEIDSLVVGYEQRQYFNEHLKQEFFILIGKLFMF